MIYESGQVRSIFPHIDDSVGLFLLGGPADGDEAQLFHKQFPAIQIVGCEPNRGFFEHQMAVGFPGLLRPEALADKRGTAPFYIMGEEQGRSSRLVVEDPASHPCYDVPTITIDEVIEESGASGQVAIWIDIERAELLALQGAVRALAQGRVHVIYLEAFAECIGAICDFLAPYGMREAERVNQHDRTNDAGVMRYGRFDAIFRKKT